jgi:hypothetical protein
MVKMVHPAQSFPTLLTTLESVEQQVWVAGSKVLVPQHWRLPAGLETTVPSQQSWLAELKALEVPRQQVKPVPTVLEQEVVVMT